MGCSLPGSGRGIGEEHGRWSTDLMASAAAATAAAKLLQSCPTLWDPTDGSPPGSPVPGILQARTLEWVAISFSNAWNWKVKVKSLSYFQLLATPWSAAHQAPPSMGFSRQEYWSGVPFCCRTPNNHPISYPWGLLARSLKVTKPPTRSISGGPCTFIGVLFCTIWVVISSSIWSQLSLIFLKFIKWLLGKWNLFCFQT